MVLPEFTEIVGISETFVVGLEVFPESRKREGPVLSTLGPSGIVLAAKTL